MDLTASFNPPRLCRLGGDGGGSYWIPALTHHGLAILVAWLDDVIPGRAERDEPIEFSSDESRAALDTDGGRIVLTWIALRDQGVSYLEAAALALDSTPEEMFRLSEVLFHRRRTLKARPRSGGDGDDIARWWIGPSVARLCEKYHMTPDDVGRLSLDQYDLLVSEGDADQKPGTLNVADVQKMWEDAWRAAGKEPPTAGSDGVPDSALEDAIAALQAAKAETNGVIDHAG